MIRKTISFSFFFLLIGGMAMAQPDRWQQRVEYTMDIDFNVNTNQYTGKQKLVYYNNSPDTLRKVFYHLYQNAFQPNSMMDVRSRTIMDPDSRVRDRIAHLTPEEIGYEHVRSLKMDGKTQKFEEVGTVLEVTLAKPIMPHSKVTFDMVFEAQIPLQVRRSGRDNKEGIRYSMSQWYPEMAEYDYQGWHADPYIAREFHGVWGDYDVTIHIDKSYILAASGVLQNPEKVGFGYTKPGEKVKQPKGDKLTWHWKAEKVHDFMWAADPDYTHVIAQVPNGPTVHFYYQKNDKTEEAWSKLPEYVIKAFQYMNSHFGKYPYDKFSVIQGGDGGMEYPMATLITGERGLSSLVGVTTHEMIHSWYQGVLATNESLYPWMDEGFTTYASAETMNSIMDENEEHPQLRNYQSYFRLANSNYDEPMTTHADHYNTNMAYSINSYPKGAVFLNQLKYVIGKEAFSEGMKRYFNTWKFKHPNDIDFLRVMEKTSGLELDWYREYFVQTTKTCDYGIKSVISEDGKTAITLEKIGKMPMPLDVEVVMQDGKKYMYNIPLRMMRGHKADEYPDAEWKVLEDWPWTHPVYTFKVDGEAKNIKEINIDPSLGMADIDRSNNEYDPSEHLKPGPAKE